MLWDELVDAWEISEEERAYVDLQQGYHCVACRSNLRSMTLASAIMKEFQSTDPSFESFCANNKEFRSSTVLEVNEAGSLSRYLNQLPKAKMISYPEYDMQDLSLESASFDLVVHSDTLEHIPDSLRALSECRRVLRNRGFLAYTVPIIHGRLSRSREGLPPCYHGTPSTSDVGMLVRTEYGADFWVELMNAGFTDIRLNALIFPGSVAIVAR